MNDFFEWTMDITMAVADLQKSRKRHAAADVISGLFMIGGAAFIGCAMCDMCDKIKQLENTVRKLEMKEVP